MRRISALIELAVILALALVLDLVRLIGLAAGFVSDLVFTYLCDTDESATGRVLREFQAGRGRRP